MTSSFEIGAVVSIYSDTVTRHGRAHLVGGRHMNETEAFRICPRCGSREVPKLIVSAARVDSSGSSWRCRGCGCDWTDAEYFSLLAS
jgi:formate dehydrogenase maturation protein FdhE